MNDAVTPRSRFVSTQIYKPTSVRQVQSAILLKLSMEVFLAQHTRTKNALTIWLLCAACLAPPYAPAQDITTLRVSTQLVLLDASLQRKKTGQPIGDLTLADFALQEDGVPQQLTYLSQDRLPLSIVFLFDLTDSVQPILKSLAAGTREVLAHLKPEDEVAIMGFSSRTMLLQDFTTDRSLATAAVLKASQMEDHEGTFIHEDMYEAVDQALHAKIPASRRVLVWLTDGSANAQNNFSQKTMGEHSPQYLHSRQEATDKLIHSDVVTSALIERSSAGDAIVALAYLGGGHMGDIHHYADLTGGPVLETSRPVVAARLAALIDELRQRETLGYKPTQTKPPGTYCKIKLQLSPSFFARHPEIKRSDIVIRTRQGYYR
jgi:VWFA-related protein